MRRVVWSGLVWLGVLVLFFSCRWCFWLLLEEGLEDLLWLVLLSLVLCGFCGLVWFCLVVLLVFLLVLFGLVLSVCSLSCFPLSWVGAAFFGRLEAGLDNGGDIDEKAVESRLGSRKLFFIISCHQIDLFVLFPF